MPDPDAPPRLPWRRHLNGFVVAGLLSTLVIPLGSALAEYDSQPLFILLGLSGATIAFVGLVIGLRLGPTRDDPRVAQHGEAAQALVERAVPLRVTRRQGGRAAPVTRLVRLDLRVEADGEPTTRVRLRRWVDVDALERLHPDAVLSARVLPGRPEDPALGLRR